VQLGVDDQAFGELTDPYLGELRVHCYRILGSLQDAEDMLQETLIAAWRGLEGYEGRASLRTWLYQIATNRCLNALRASSRRPRTEAPDPSFVTTEPTRRGSPVWVEPYPDVLLPDVGAGPEARYEAKESIALAFVAALQHLPPRQRVVLVLRDVLGFRAAGPDGGERPAGVRAVHTGWERAGVPRVRARRTDPRGRPDLRCHQVCRQ
jgi:RNA polymerase sigma-70 factor (TIGR02960 family)